MAILSAGIRVNEFDFSGYAAELGITRFCALGGATKGAINTPTEVNSKEELIETFGYPLTTDYGLQAALDFLKKGDQLIYNRVADSNAAEAKVSVPGTSGGTAAEEAEGVVSFTGSTNPSDAETVTIHETVPWLNLENDGNGAVGNVGIWTNAPSRISVSGMAGGGVSAQAVGFIKLIGSALPLDGDTIIIGDGTDFAVFVFDTSWPTGPTGPSGPTGPTGPTNATGPTGWTGDTTRVDIRTITNPYLAMAALHSEINGHAFDVSSVNYADTLKYIFEFDDDASYTVGNVPVLIGTTAALSLTNLVTAVTGSGIDMVAVDGTVTVPQMDLTQGTGGIDGNATVFETGGNIGATGMAGGVDAIAGSGQTLFDVLAKTEGSWGNGIQVIITATAVQGGAADHFDMVVMAPVTKDGSNEEVERFLDCSLTAADDRYVETMVEDGIIGDTDPSNYIKVDIVAAGTVTPATLTLGASGPTEGDDGISALASTDYVGTVSGTTATGLQAVLNAEKVEFNVLAVPGQTHKDVITALLLVAETRGDCIAIVDPPFGLTRDEAIDWHNGSYTGLANQPIAALDSSYGTYNWSWLKRYDAYNKQNIWLPPSGFIAANVAYTDQTKGPWFTIAGHNRGRLDADEVEYSPSEPDRDVLCPLVGDNRVNPIVDFSDGGPTLFGNRTLSRAQSLYADVHVRRLLLRAEKLCATSVKYLVFEPNDPDTWSRFTQMCNKVLGDIAKARGLETFRVICDATTNPLSRRLQKKMKGKLMLVPIGAAEGIEIDFAVFSSGAEFNEAA